MSCLFSTRHFCHFGQLSKNVFGLEILRNTSDRISHVLLKVTACHGFLSLLTAALMHEDANIRSSHTSFTSRLMNSSFESSILPPCYSQDPAHDETRLELSSSRTTRQLPTDIFTKACGSATVVLFNQEPGVRVPSYRRERCVRGTLILAQDTGNICRVVAKVPRHSRAPVFLWT